MDVNNSDIMVTGNKLIEQRISKLKDLREKGIDPFYNKFKVKNNSAQAIEYGKDKTNEELEAEAKEFILAGRMMMVRDFGKIAFATIHDRYGKIQLYFAKKSIGDAAFELFKTLDIGDIIGVHGVLFYTKTMELTINVTKFELLTKSIRPLPEKWHGLTDIETRYRQRYVDLIVNPQVRETFVKRAKIINTIRDYFNARDFLEVETPMMHSIAGGATARPFTTHHNALDMELFMRIAPELHLKRLIVGGFERVFEINRNFRNEGISIQHNPEFTMLEFYMAYATFNDLMDFTEDLITTVAKEVCGTLKITYQGEEVDLTPPWKRLTVKAAIIEYTGVSADILNDKQKAQNYAKSIGIEVENDTPLGKIIVEIFEQTVENKLLQPTFITDYPIEVSPLSRKNDNDSGIVDRFELFVVRRELANAFSELNDPIDQRERFLEQVRAKEKGDLEACGMDEDYIRALSYGLPPTAGQGIGIDRLAMLLTDSASIRDVILFPQMRAEKKGEVTKTHDDSTPDEDNS